MEFVLVWMQNRDNYLSATHMQRQSDFTCIRWCQNTTDVIYAPLQKLLILEKHEIL